MGFIIGSPNGCVKGHNPDIGLSFQDALVRHRSCRGVRRTWRRVARRRRLHERVRTRRGDGCSAFHLDRGLPGQRGDGAQRQLAERRAADAEPGVRGELDGGELAAALLPGRQHRLPAPLRSPQRRLGAAGALSGRVGDLRADQPAGRFRSERRGADRAPGGLRHRWCGAHRQRRHPHPSGLPARRPGGRHGPVRRLVPDRQPDRADARWPDRRPRRVAVGVLAQRAGLSDRSGGRAPASAAAGGGQARGRTRSSRQPGDHDRRRHADDRDHVADGSRLAPSAGDRRDRGIVSAGPGPAVHRTAGGLAGGRRGGHPSGGEALPRRLLHRRRKVPADRARQSLLPERGRCRPWHGRDDAAADAGRDDPRLADPRSVVPPLDGAPDHVRRLGGGHVRCRPGGPRHPPRPDLAGDGDPRDRRAGDGAVHRDQRDGPAGARSGGGARRRQRHASDAAEHRQRAQSRHRPHAAHRSATARAGGSGARR